ncbi:hypothetical protein RUM43_007803 [Polyplax serrata]|uniref:Major facilitator superfamily associated domain-containing protein n=1 Tax=Polyplax serrata TaxID=468196 RepID=A0AAN8P999_POLSC
MELTVDMNLVVSINKFILYTLMGYSLGSLLGGFLYKNIGGRLTFQLFSVLAVLCCITHMILYKTVLSQSYNKGNVKERKTPGEEVKMMATVPG